LKIDTSKVEEILNKKLEVDVKADWDFNFEEDGPAECEVKQGKVGKWYGVKILVKYSGRTSDPSTSRALGDPEEGHAWYDWIGLAETAPVVVTKPEELTEWAHLATAYRMTLRDVQVPGSFGFHSGTLLWDLTENGKAKVYIVTERNFQDVSPMTKTKEEIIDLNKIKK